MKANSPYYVGIDQPRLLRKDLLESAKYSVAILKEKKILLELSQKRYEKVTELRKLLVGMSKDLSELTNVLPKHSSNRVPSSAKQIQKRMEEKKKQELEAKKKAERSKKPVVKDAQSDDATSLEVIRGVGPKRAKELSKAGYGSVESLAVAYADEIEQATGISQGHAQKLIDFAQTIVSSQGADDSQKSDSKQQQHSKTQQEEPSEIELLEQKLNSIESKLNNL